MTPHTLTALSPLDGRYAASGEALRPIFSEYGLFAAEKISRYFRIGLDFFAIPSASLKIFLHPVCFGPVLLAHML